LADPVFALEACGRLERRGDGVRFTTIDSLNDEDPVDQRRAVIAERAMWWPGSFASWYEVRNSPGATETGLRGALAEGEVGGPRGVDTSILLANTSSTAGSVKVTLLFEDGTSAARTFSVAPNRRFLHDVRRQGRQQAPEIGHGPVVRPEFRTASANRSAAIIFSTRSAGVSRRFSRSRVRSIPPL
jgi:hypothetical protein